MKKTWRGAIRLAEMPAAAGHSLLDSGYMRAWFEWIQWIALTSLLYVAYEKTGARILLALAVYSMLAILFVACAAIDRLGDDISARKGSSRLFKAAGIILVAVVSPWAVLETISGILIATGGPG